VSSRFKLVVGAVVLVAFAVGAFAAFSSSGRSGTTSEQVASWVAASELGSTVGTLQADATRISTVLDQQKGLSAVHTDCAVLQQDATSANSVLPTPDGRLTAELSKAYALSYDAGADCLNAGSISASLFHRSTDERHEARTALLRALAQVKRLTGKTVATTTTTQPPSGGIFG